MGKQYIRIEKKWAIASLLLFGISSGMMSVGSQLIVKEYEKQKAQYKRLWDVTAYLLDIIEKNEDKIDLTAFDWIALRELGFVEQPKDES